MKTFLSFIVASIGVCDAFVAPKPPPATATTTAIHSFTPITDDMGRQALSFPDKAGADGMPERFQVSADALRQRKALTRSKWGVDNSHEAEYWFDNRIHTLGNAGFMGALHAAIAPLSTKLIDQIAYGGVDIRKQVAKELYFLVGKAKARVVDLCCGVGISTRALSDVFHDAETVMGIDTSAEMVAMADFLTGHLTTVKPLWGVRPLATKISNGYGIVKEQGLKLKAAARRGFASFKQGNAEDTKLPENHYDLVTVMYAFHEAPKAGRDKILREAKRLLQPGGTLAVIDICTDYVPSEQMLKGEPYVLEYQENIKDQLDNAHGFRLADYKSLVQGHVGMWILKRTAKPAVA